MADKINSRLPYTMKVINLTSPDAVWMHINKKLLRGT